MTFAWGGGMVGQHKPRPVDFFDQERARITADRIAEADAYLAARTGKYAWRRVRYGATASVLRCAGLDDTHTVVDVGAGWTELDYCLRVEAGWRGRYIPVDACIDGVDLERTWNPRLAEWYVALEVAEHLDDPWKFLTRLQGAATRGVVISTPNPATTDVLGMDPTHRTEVTAALLDSLDFAVSARSFYGKEADSLLGVWPKSLSNPTGGLDG